MKLQGKFIATWVKAYLFIIEGRKSYETFLSFDFFYYHCTFFYFLQPALVYSLIGITVEGGETRTRETGVATPGQLTSLDTGR